MARIKHHYEFISGISIDGEVYFNKYSLMIDLYTLSGIPADQNVAIDRMSYFIHNTVARSIFINEADTKNIKLLTKAGLPVLTVPEPGAFDPVVLAVIVTKLNAILEDVLVITTAELMSEINGAMTHVWEVIDLEDEIHSMVNGDDDTRWWSSPDPRFGSYPAGIDVDKIEEKSPFPLTWEMLDLEWAGEYVDETVTYTAEPSTSKSRKKGVIIKANFNRDTPKK